MKKGIRKTSLVVLISVSGILLVPVFPGAGGFGKQGATAVLPANKTEILFDGERIDALAGFTFKVYKDRQDVRGIGANEPIGVVYAEGETDEEGNLILTTYGTPLDRVVRMMYRRGRPFQDLAAQAEAHGRPRPRAAFERLHVKGKILVHSNSEMIDGACEWSLMDQAERIMESACPLLNELMHNNTSFQIVVSIMQDSYPEGLGIKTFVFDGVHIDDREFQLDSHGNVLTTYTFTADRIREA